MCNAASFFPRVSRPKRRARVKSEVKGARCLARLLLNCTRDLRPVGSKRCPTANTPLLSITTYQSDHTFFPLHPSPPTFPTPPPPSPHSLAHNRPLATIYTLSRPLATLTPLPRIFNMTASPSIKNVVVLGGSYAGESSEAHCSHTSQRALQYRISRR